MSSLEERDVGVAAAPGSSSAGLGVGAVGAAVEAAAGVAAMQDEVGIRREGPESDTDEPPKKRLKIPEGESGKLEERLYSVLCCTVCLDLPKASVYQVNLPHRAAPSTTAALLGLGLGAHHVSQPPSPTVTAFNTAHLHIFYRFCIQRASQTFHSYCIWTMTPRVHTHTHTQRYIPFILLILQKLHSTSSTHDPQHT
ncbi:unnamed protein product [Tetraodon nigroviridis]|uniref:(spotted green pufferfish) hypothetical protein n=1 Tax=Tetraodon nigroviridis TaxID=99883 RepID=Q4RNM1_TETNG|nr:unnamed protein product [Tetraodon nigroviridis]